MAGIGELPVTFPDFDTIANIDDPAEQMIAMAKATTTFSLQMATFSAAQGAQDKATDTMEKMTDRAAT